MMFDDDEILGVVNSSKCALIVFSKLTISFMLASAFRKERSG